jgi:predicted small lipoprotein YifL
MLAFARAVGERPLADYRLSVGVALAAAVAAALSLGACGRKGELELPPGPASQPPVAAAPASPTSFMPSYGGSGAPATQQQEDAAAIKNGFDARGNPVAAAPTKKSFILDPILQ